MEGSGVEFVASGYIAVIAAAADNNDDADDDDDKLEVNQLASTFIHKINSLMMKIEIASDAPGTQRIDAIILILTYFCMNVPSRKQKPMALNNYLPVEKISFIQIKCAHVNTMARCTYENVRTKCIKAWGG